MYKTVQILMKTCAEQWSSSWRWEQQFLTRKHTLGSRTSQKKNKADLKTFMIHKTHFHRGWRYRFREKDSVIFGPRKDPCWQHNLFNIDKNKFGRVRLRPKVKSYAIGSRKYRTVSIPSLLSVEYIMKSHWRSGLLHVDTTRGTRNILHVSLSFLYRI